MKLGKRAKRRGGFTLIELLLVVAILAVLAFLAVPAIATTIRNARVRTCGSNEKMIEQGIWRWYADQVAAGHSLNLVNTEVNGTWTDALTIAAVPGTLFDGNTLVTPLVGYFTPGGVPTCPFETAVADAYNIYLVTRDNGLHDVRVMCSQGVPILTEANGGHLRAADRPTAVPAGSILP